MAFEWSVAAKQETTPIPCPHCGVPLLRQARYFCAKCEWNKADLEEHWRFLMRFTLVMAAVIIPLTVVLTGLAVNWHFAAVIAIFPFSVIFAIAFLYQRAALRDVMAASAPPELASFELLKGQIPKMQAFIGAAIVLAGVLMAWSIEWPFGIIPALITAAFLILIVRAFRKEHAILVNRGFVMGRVIEQKWQGRRVSVITYTFQDALGKETRGTAQDRCWIYEPKMDVPIFYDRSRPEWNLPITAFFVYELRQ